MLNESRQAERSRVYDSMHVKCPTSRPLRDGKQVAAARAAGRRGWERLSGCRFFFSGSGMALNWVMVMVVQYCEYAECHYW